ncbi:MAG: XamI family restriction endonuclease [Kiritimatiellae bacterium]|nr:XamI family restriction endonuclease [Kiritimatiellia bacterium]
MPINMRNTEHWSSDVQKSVLFYNDWFLRFAPKTYVATRKSAMAKVEAAFSKTDFFRNITPELLEESPESVAILRMSTIPPLARDRLAGLAYVPKQLVASMEDGKCPHDSAANARMVQMINRLLDKEIMPWLARGEKPSKQEAIVASAIIGDRVCGSLADPIIRNEQERRQLNSIKAFLEKRGYALVPAKDVSDCTAMSPGTFAYHLNVSAKMARRRRVNIPVDVVVMRKSAKPSDLPLFIECKSAGDFTNTNKRRKEEAVKQEQLKKTYGSAAGLLLFLCGYFDGGYLGYEAVAGIDWVWEHRIDDLEKAGV